MKYIFVAGAPGSKWSSVVKNIYYSSSVDNSDYRDEWTYYHDASGKTELMHLGAYFDPGMECSLPEDLTRYTKEQLESLFDAPFDKSSQGVRIIKSHIFSEHIDFLRATWPEVPIVLVYRSDDACLGWWVKCGHFDITYPRYRAHYKNLKEMARIIKQQNQGIVAAWRNYTGINPASNHDLARLLKLAPPLMAIEQVYEFNNIEVKVI